MTVDVFRVSLSTEVPLDEAEMTLQLATFAAEGLFGIAQVRLDVGYHLDRDHHAILIDGTTEVGAAVVRLFLGLLLREFGEDAFHIDRVCSTPTTDSQEAAA